MSAAAESTNCKEAPAELEFLEVQYQVLSDRRINHNALLWNVPSLLFVAQTFLWTLALDSAKNAVIRLIISILSIMTAYVSYQLFERNRLLEVIDSEQMYSIETYIHEKYYTLPVMFIHHKADRRTLISGEHKTVTDFIHHHSYYRLHKDKHCLCQQESSTLWKIIFILTLVISVVISMYNLTEAVLLFTAYLETV